MTRLGILSIALILLCLGALSPGAAEAQPKKGDEQNDAKQARLQQDQDALKRIAELRAKLAKFDSKEEVELRDEKKEEARQAARQAIVAALIAALREAPNPTTRDDNLALVAMLHQTIETKALQEKVKLKTALEHLSEIFPGMLPIIVYKEAFTAEFGADAPDPYEEEVSLPPVPAKMTLNVALRLILSQIGKGEATFLIRQGHIEITTLKASSAAYLLAQEPIFASFDNRPLQEVLDQFADESGIAIQLDPNVGKKGQTAIKAKFFNASLEDALVTVTEMAELKYVILERSIYITTPEKAAILSKEEKKRALERKEARPKAKRLEAAS